MAKSKSKPVKDFEVSEGSDDDILYLMTFLFLEKSCKSWKTEEGTS